MFGKELGGSMTGKVKRRRKERKTEAEIMGKQIL